MRRDVQLFLGKEVLNPPSTGNNIVYNPAIGDGTGYNRVNHTSVDSGLMTVTSLKGSAANFNQDISDLEPNKKYRLTVNNLTYPSEGLTINRLRQTEDFNTSSWTRAGVAVTTNNTLAPDGTLADKIFAYSYANYCRQNLYAYSNQPLFVSLYAKKDTASNFKIVLFKDNITFNFDTESISSTGKFSGVGFKEINDGWYRVYGKYTPSNSFTLSAGISSIPSGYGMFLWGFQVERSHDLNLYLRNDSSTTDSYSHVNTDLRTVENKILYSDDLSNPAWGKARVNLTSGIDGFYGNNYGFRLESQFANQTSYVAEDTAITEVGEYVVSTYVKSDTATYASFRVQQTGDSKRTDYSMRFSDGLLSDKGTDSGFLNNVIATPLAMGWFKLDFYVNVTNTSGSLKLLVSQRSSDGAYYSSVGAVSSMYMAHSGINSGNIPSQYIRTTGMALSLSAPDRTFKITDSSQGGLQVEKPLVAGTTSFTVDFITNQNTGNLKFEIEDQNATFEFSVDRISIVERIDPYYSKKRYAVDMFDFEDLNVVDKIKDVRDISKVFTEYSQKFTVPASANNNELFDHFYDEGVVSGFDHRIKHDAVIKIGGADYKHGQLTLLSSNLKNGVPHSYSVVFYGNTVKLNDLLGDDQLSDLTGTILDKLNIEYSSANIFDLMTHGMFFDENNDLVVGTDNSEYAATPDVFVPFISCDSHYFYDSVDQQQVKDRVSSRNVKYPSGQSTRGIYYKDLKLAVKVKYIIQAIQEKYGVTFSSDFFSEDVPEFNELSLFLHKEKGGISSQLETSKDAFTLGDLVKSYQIFQSNTEYRGVARRGANDIGWNNDYLDFINQSSFASELYGPRGYYSYRLTFDIEVIGAGEYTLNITDTSPSPDGQGFSWSGTGDKSIAYVFRGGTDNTNNTPAGVVMHFEYVIPRFEISTQSGISEYKIKNFKIEPVHAASGRYSRSAESWNSIGSKTKYKLNNEDFNELGSGVELTSQLPNMKVIDFLTSMFKTFNLTAYSVPETEISEYAGQIRVRTLDSYYLSGKKVDISHYVDTATKNVNRNKLYSEVKFEFDKLSTLAAVNAFERTGDTFGNEVMNNLSSSLDSPLAFDGGKYSVKNKFEKVMYERMTDQSDETTILPIQWGWMASKDENPIVGKPLLFYPMYQDTSIIQDEAGDFVNLDYDTSIYDKNKNVITQSHTQFHNYIRPSNCLIDNGSSLHFGSEFDEWYVWDGEGSNENSLFNKYYKNYLLSIYDKQSRLINIETHLPVETIMKLKLEDIVIINSKRYRINSLDLNITTGKAKMELMNDLVYAQLTPEPVYLIDRERIIFGRHYIKLVDDSYNEDTNYNIYLNGSFYRYQNGGAIVVTISNNDLNAGDNEVNVTKLVDMGGGTVIESEFSNTITLTKV